jgi:hypothetical protein
VQIGEWILKRSAVEAFFISSPHCPGFPFIVFSGRAAQNEATVTPIEDLSLGCSKQVARVFSTWRLTG